SSNICVPCANGYSRPPGDNPTSVNTECGAITCSANQRVENNACVACDAGTTNAADDDASGANTACEVTLCAENQYVSSNACVACASGTINAANDDASSSNTACDSTAICRYKYPNSNENYGGIDCSVGCPDNSVHYHRSVNSEQAPTEDNVHFICAQTSASVNNYFWEGSGGDGTDWDPPHASGVIGYTVTAEVPVNPVLGGGVNNGGYTIRQGTTIAPYLKP
ncbi:MAG: hypothetical protein VYA34_04120, partial [Myxococcota bacterium]|nr:hypothetical protein [Myxococcota bacterium]